jgi:tRNA threonylcarbamoyladenosine biosynthesis protein TsaB
LPAILSIETATNICSVALSVNGELLSLKESSVKNAHSSVLTDFIDECFRSSGIKPSALDAIAVSEGPGSYTGLRIGVAAAKGLCYALEKPLIAIPTLQAMAAGMIDPAPVVRSSATEDFLCPMIDARRMEVFSAVFNKDLSEIRETLAEIITDSSFSDILKEHGICFAGDGAAKCKPFLEKNENAYFLEDFQVSARYMIHLAEQKFLSGKFVDLAYFEPRYLKEFVAGKPRVKGLTD